MRFGKHSHSCPDNTRTYNATVLDIKLIRERPDFVKERLKTRGAGDEALVEKVLSADEARRKVLAEVETLKAKRNQVSKEIGALMSQKKAVEAGEEKGNARVGGEDFGIGRCRQSK